MWSFMVEQMANVKVENIADLEAAVHIAWTAVDKSKVKNLVHSPPHRFQLCIEADGGQIYKK